MAALVIPLITTLGPVVIPLLVRLVDKLFGSKTGAVKFQSVIAAIQAILEGMVKAGQITKEQMPTEAAIQAQVQAVVDQLNAAGELQGLGTALPAAPVSGSVKDGLEGLQMMLSGYLKVTAALGAK